MSNPLLQKYDELYGKKEEPKEVEQKKEKEKFELIPSDVPFNYYVNPSATNYISTQNTYKANKNTIATLEAFLEDLKTGRAIMVDCKTEENYNHLSVNPIDYFPSHSLADSRPVPVDRGSQITFTIFRKYV